MGTSFDLQTSIEFTFDAIYEEPFQVSLYIEHILGQDVYGQNFDALVLEMSHVEQLPVWRSAVVNPTMVIDLEMIIT